MQFCYKSLLVHNCSGFSFKARRTDAVTALEESSLIHTMSKLIGEPDQELLSQQLRRITIDGPESQYVRLNVGGYFFSTTTGTLVSRDTMLRAMFSGKMEVLTDPEGWILIDRSGKHFGRILNWLRDGHVPLPALQHEIEELALEAKYYLCEELLLLCEAKLSANAGPEPEPICQVPYVTNQLEEQMLLLMTKRPVVKLQINRYNNKYSYTSASEENLLKSLELFDKLALKFCKRILFMKDVVSTNEICCWVFHGNNKKQSEVCCTSIVYTSDKGKHTKVEFPESRILEETLNILLFERPFAAHQQLQYQLPANQNSLSPTHAPSAAAAGGGAVSDAVGSPHDSNAQIGARLRHLQHHHHAVKQPSVEQPPDVIGIGSAAAASSQSSTTTSRSTPSVATGSAPTHSSAAARAVQAQQPARQQDSVAETSRQIKAVQ